MRKIRIPLALLCLILFAGCSNLPKEHNVIDRPEIQSKLIAIIGDFGSGDDFERQVAQLVAREEPIAVVTVGDNVYSDSGYEKLVGDYYEKFLKNKVFYPATGNHDYELGIENFDSFFGTNSETRHYKFTVANVDYFVLDSERIISDHESYRDQKSWLIESANASTATFKVVVLHHPPFSSSTHHGSTPILQWDFSGLGIDIVVSGHDHTYERLSKGGVTYIVDGTGGKSLYQCGSPLPNSKICLDKYFGALFISSSKSVLTGEFKGVDGVTIDSFTLYPSTN